MKTCSVCSKSLPASSYWKRNKSPDGLCVQCKDCMRSRRAERDWQVEKARQMEIHGPDRFYEMRRETILKHRYGMTYEDLREMEESQGNKCLSCQSSPKKLHVDHCHDTGRVRGLLCGPCNRALGLMKEDVDSIIRLAEYIEGHSLVRAND